MANNSNRVYLPREQAEQIVRALDNARLSVGSVADTAALVRLTSAAQWVVHQEPFLAIHQELWKEREEGAQ